MSQGYYRRMKKKKRKTACIVGAVMLILAAFTGYYQYEKKEAEKGFGTISDINAPQKETLEEEKEKEKGTITVKVINVGDALSVLVDYGQDEVLYDCGYAKDGARVSEAIKDSVDGKLDYLIISHSHADHCGGAERICSDYDIGTIITSGETEGDSNEFRRAYKAIQKEGCRIIRDRNLSFSIGEDMTMNIIETYDPGDIPNVNNLSVIAYFERDEERILLTGDAEEDAEKMLIGKTENISVLVAGHHMSNTSCSAALLNQWQPAYIIASCAGEKSEYGFPGRKALERCQKVSEEIYGTYRSGDIVIRLTGTQTEISAGENEKITSE